MKITILVDNTPAHGCGGEWGLSAYIEHAGRHLLLDTGTTSLFRENAGKLGISLEGVDTAVLSHAHYDHAGGLRAFFESNSRAPLWVTAGAEENCYKLIRVRHRYIGIPRGLLEEYAPRIHRCDSFCSLGDGIYLLPHSSPDLGATGAKNRMYLRAGRRYTPDDFRHEQTLVVDTGRGLVLLNSCSHAGPEVILSEIRRAFPGEKILGYVGGLHLYLRSEEEIDEVARIFRESSIEQIYTGHCTGDAAYARLEGQLGRILRHLESGLEISF